MKLWPSVGSLASPTRKWLLCLCCWGKGVVGRCEGMRVILSVPQDHHTPHSWVSILLQLLAKLGNLLSWEGHKEQRERGSTSKAVVAQLSTQPGVR